MKIDLVGIPTAVNGLEPFLRLHWLSCRFWRAADQRSDFESIYKRRCPVPSSSY
jgi:hypothetical protein